MQICGSKVKINLAMTRKVMASYRFVPIWSQKGVFSEITSIFNSNDILSLAFIPFRIQLRFMSGCVIT